MEQGLRAHCDLICFHLEQDLSYWEARGEESVHGLLLGGGLIAMRELNGGVVCVQDVRCNVISQM